MTRCRGLSLVVSFLLPFGLTSGIAFAQPDPGAAAASPDAKAAGAASSRLPSDEPQPPPARLDGRAPKLDFNFFDAKPSPSTSPSSTRVEQDARINALVQTRRHRLTVHQTLGLVTWGLMLATCVVGQLNYHDLYGGGSGRGTWLFPHRALAYSSAIMFGTTAGYALLAPKPYPKPLRLDTGLIHRIAAIGASAGMVAQIVLGFITARTADAGNPDGLKRNAQIHEVVGWSTFGFMTVAGTAWLF